MDLNTIEMVMRPSVRAELPALCDGDTFLGGGTWLFSEPQVAARRLIDLGTLQWPALRIDAEGLHIAATCTIAQLEAHSLPPEWTASPLVRSCCRALLGSFKIWNTATVGGNICLALPAAPMVSLASALDGVCQIWQPDGGERHLPVLDFVCGERLTALAPGEVLRAVFIPASSFRRRSAFRQISLTTLGRSAALLIGTRDAAGFHLTITAATPRPVRVTFPAMVLPSELAHAIDAGVAKWHDDLHGSPDWRRHITHLAAQEIRAELDAP